MASWGFWDWIGYIGILGAAVFIALETGLTRVPQARSYFPFLTARWWGFAPLVLILLSSAILLVRVVSPPTSPISTTALPISGPDPSAKVDNVVQGQPPKTEDNYAHYLDDYAHDLRMRAAVPANLSVLSDSDLAETAKGLAQQIGDFAFVYVQNSDSIKSDGSRPDDQKSFARAELDRTTTQQFRAKFEDDFNRVQSELLQRLRSELPISEQIATTGQLTSEQMYQASVRLYELARRLAE